MSPATGKEKRSRTSRYKLTTKKASKISRTNTTKPHTKPAKVQKPLGPGTRLGASSLTPIFLLDSDEEGFEQHHTVYGEAYVPDSLITPPTTASGSNLQQDLSRFRCSSSFASPAPSSASLYSPILSILPPTSFVLRRTAPAQPASLPGEAQSELYQKTSYATPPTTFGDDIRERESSLFMSASHPVNNERPTTMGDSRTSKLFSRIKSDTPVPYKFRTCKRASGSGPKIQSDDAMAFDAHLLFQADGRRDGKTGEAICEGDNLSAHQESASLLAGIVHSDDEEAMVKLDPNDSAYECDSDATDATELESVAQRRCLARAKAKSKCRPTKSSKITKPRNVRKEPVSMAIKSVRSNRDHPTKMRVTKSNRPSAARKRRQNSIDRDFLVSDNEIYVESDYSSASSSDEGQIDGSDTEMKDLEDDCADLRINMRLKYVFNAEILKKQE